MKSIKLTIFLAVFMALLGPAVATFFGFVPAPCDFGDIHDPQAKNCYYCPKGSELKGGYCKGLPTIGDRCPHGQDKRYEENSRRCVYCETGYVFLFKDNKCSSKKASEDL